MIILIPAYEPDHRLVDLVESIDAERFDQQIVVVDDGSGPDYAPVFDALRSLGCDVIGHPANRGKGFALKRGFAHIAARYPNQDVVCADCDGQHAYTDIARVADELQARRSDIVLGARQFAGDVPARSRFGNNLTRSVLAVLSGLRLQDTQTGLRGYPAALLAWLQSVDGERFEYELEVLLAARRIGLTFHEIPIQTIYLDGNRSSHFRSVRDSIRVYVPFVKFSLSSLAAFSIDALMFFGLMAMTASLAFSVVASRLISASVNFAANRRLVFAGKVTRPLTASRRYAVLVVALMTANYAVLRTLTGPVSMALIPAKVVTDLSLFVISYKVQRRFVFHDDSATTTLAGGRRPARLQVGSQG